MLITDVLKQTGLLINNKRYIFSFSPKVDLEKFDLTEEPTEYIMMAVNINDFRDYSKVYTYSVEEISKLKEANKLDALIEEIRIKIISELENKK
jgi:hypothetical protein